MFCSLDWVGWENNAQLIKVHQVIRVMHRIYEKRCNILVLQNEQWSPEVFIKLIRTLVLSL